VVVEDEAKLRKVAVQMLDRLGLRTMQAETAKDALELLADTHVDVLFTDIELGTFSCNHLSCRTASRA
jgi:CheY-like chemotaxis protein